MIYSFKAQGYHEEGVDFVLFKDKIYSFCTEQLIQRFSGDQSSFLD